jgi:hypothetical protein
MFMYLQLNRTTKQINSKLEPLFYLDHSHHSLPIFEYYLGKKHWEEGVVYEADIHAVSLKG